jgi:DNA polymerase III sliding clamp (beta) subunit (PCNA family)
MQETSQRTIFGEQIEEQIRIETTGRVIRPFKRAISQIAKEYTLQFSDDGIRVEVIDSGNVQGGYFNLHASAFDEYWIEEDTTLGITQDSFGSVLQHARYGKRSDDPITLSGDAEYLQSEVTRPFGKSEATINERAALTDPDAIRGFDGVPDLDLDVTTEIHPKTFIEAIKAMDTKSHVRLGSNIDSITFNQEMDLTKRNINIETDPSEVSEWTFYSGRYLENVQKSLSMSYADSCTLTWDEEFPLMVEFEREDIISGTIMTAPRIQSGPEDRV